MIISPCLPLVSACWLWGSERGLWLERRVCQLHGWLLESTGSPGLGSGPPVNEGLEWERILEGHLREWLRGKDLHPDQQEGPALKLGLW